MDTATKIFLTFEKIKPLIKSNNFIRYLRNKSWKPECVLSFNMGCRILVFYPEPEAFADNVTNNLCCPIRADDNSSTGIFTTGKSVT
jgi:hypothetical protein